MTCSLCGRLAHVDFATRTRRCSGCGVLPARCQCQPFVPEWVRRARTNTLVRKDYTAA